MVQLVGKGGGALRPTCARIWVGQVFLRMYPIRFELKRSAMRLQPTAYLLPTRSACMQAHERAVCMRRAPPPSPQSSTTTRVNFCGVGIAQVVGMRG
jgi:hypothetical protein